jgi:RND superfamily putative drug exporter
MLERLAQAVTRRPWWVIAGWLIAAAAIVLVAPGLGSVTNADQAAFLPANAESARAAALAARDLPSSSRVTAIIVVTRPGGTLTPADIAALDRLAGGTAAPGGAGTSGGSAALPRPAGVSAISFDPTTGVAPDRKVALLVVGFAGPAERADTQAAVTALRHAMTGDLAGSGLSAGMTGQAAVVVDNKQAFGHATAIVAAVTLTLIVVLLLLIFRSPVAALLPLLTVGLVYAVTTGLVALGAHALHTQVGQELPTMLTVVLFGIGTDYVLFLLFRYRERLRMGESPAEAIVSAVGRVGEAIACAALTVIAAFGALVLAVLGFFRTLGPSLAVAVAVMLLAVLTLVPAVVRVLGRFVFRPATVTRPATRAPRTFPWLGRLVGRRPGLVLAAGVLLLGAAASGLTVIQPNYDPIAQLPSGTESERAFNDLLTGFPAGALSPTTVYLHASQPLDAAQVGAFTAVLAAVPGVASPLPAQSSVDGRTVAVPVVLSDAPYSMQALSLVDGPLRSAARRAAPSGSTVLVGGQSMAYADVRSGTDRDLRVIFPVAAALFVLILAGLLRALPAPGYLVLLVVAGFVAALGATAWMYRAHLAFTIPIVLYLFVTAIGTDYNILVTARLREEVREGRPPREAAALAVAHAGPSVAAAAAILAGTFGALLVSGVPFFVQIGFAVTLGILLVAFVVSMLLVPAVSALAGRAAWWPGRPAGAAVAVDLTPAERDRRRRQQSGPAYRPGPGRPW